MGSSIKTVEIEVTIAGLPSAFDGLRVGLFSDLHFSRSAGRREREVAQILADTAVDVLTFTGDAVNRSESWPRAVEWFGTLPDCDLKLAVPGNWDYVRGTTARDYVAHMRDAGFTTLLNASIGLERANARLWFSGLEDPRGGDPDAKRTFKDVTEGACTITLCHSPDILLELDPTFFGLMLCGHTHGGQICLPGYGALYTSTRVGKKYEYGLHEVGRGRYVYVTRGIGTTGVPFRLFCPGEVVFFTLHALDHGD
ncbi:MAG: metallophosphoesterase [Verrucomicrobia bacterium]|nr:metallophosphoesterase [Verrucomicrobiota bacterium]